MRALKYLFGACKLPSVHRVSFFNVFLSRFIRFFPVLKDFDSLLNLSSGVRDGLLIKDRFDIDVVPHFVADLAGNSL